MTLALILQPAVILLAGNSAELRVNLMCARIKLLEERPVSVAGGGIGTMLGILDQDLLERTRCGRQLLPLLQGLIDRKKVSDQHADAIGIGHQMADFEKDFRFSGRPFHEDHPEDIPFKRIRGLAAPSAQESLKSGMGRKTHRRDGRGTSFLFDELHRLASFLDKADAQAVIALI